MSLTQSIPYTTPGNYTHDSSKVLIDGDADLIAPVGDEDFTEDFADDTGHTYDSSKTTFSAGQIFQPSQQPSQSYFGATYASSIDGDWGQGGSLTGTATGGAGITSGKLDLRSGGKYVDYALGSTISAGAIKFKYTPNYSGFPASDRALFTIAEDVNDDSNRVQCVVSDNGFFVFSFKGSGGSTVNISVIPGTWSVTAGTEYEVEVNWDIDSAVYVFIDGVLLGSESGSWGTSSPGVPGLLRIGASYETSPTNTADGQFRDLIVFQAIQHTTGYTPGYTVATDLYAGDTITHPAFTHVGATGSTFQTFEAFTVTGEIGAPRYTIQIDSNGYYYWDGAAWSSSDGTYAQAASSADTNTNIGTFPGITSGTTSITVRTHTTDGATQAGLSQIDLETTSQGLYPTDNPTIVAASVNADGLDGFSATSTASGSDAVKFTLIVGGVETYHNGSAWTTSDGTYAQSNTAAEIETNKATLDLSAGVSLAVKAFLHSDDGSTSPSLDSVTVLYDFAAPSLTSATSTIVYGWVYGDAQTARSGLTVKATAKDNLESGSVLVLKETEITTTTDSSGFYELDLIAGTYQFEIDGKLVASNVVVSGSDATSNLTDLI